MTEAVEPGLTQRQQALIDELFAPTSEAYALQLARYRAVREAALNAMGRALSSSLNVHLASAPQESLGERRELASEVNRCLKSLSLAIRCPRTGRPAILVVDTLAGEKSHVSRFRLQTVDARGRQQRTLTSLSLPLPLELIPASDRVEGFSRGYAPRGPTRPR